MDIAELSLASQAAWFELLAEHGYESRRSTGALAVVTGLASNSENGVVTDGRGLGDIRALMGLIDWVAGRGVPASLILREPASRESLAELERRGLLSERSAHEMGLTLGEDAMPSATSPAAVVDEVREESALRAGLQALGQEWFEDDDLDRRFELYSRIGYGPGSTVRHWTAERAGSIVGMASSFRFDDIVALTGCGVRAPFRRRGIATALTGCRLRAAFADGARSAILSPSPDGYELHRHLGFTLVPLPPDRWFYLPTQS